MTISTNIDRLGSLNEQIKSLQSQADSIKKALKVAGVEHADGRDFHLDVVTQERSYLDQKAVKAKLSPQFLAAHTRTSTVRSFKVTRIQQQVAA